MPSSATVMQAFTRSARPSRTTLHNSQSPVGFIRGSAHIAGISMPARRAAARMVSPAIASTDFPSISQPTRLKAHLGLARMVRADPGVARALHTPSVVLHSLPLFVAVTIWPLMVSRIFAVSLFILYINKSPFEKELSGDILRSYPFGTQGLAGSPSNQIFWLWILPRSSVIFEMPCLKLSISSAFF